MKPLAPITYDYSGLIAPKDAPPFVRQTGLVEADLKWLAPRLAAARQEVLDNLALYQRGGPVPEEMQPLDAAFFDLPERLLDEERPLLDRIIAAGDRLAKEVDRVVVLGIGGSYMGARALFEACCHPYHNEISRQRRGGRPRIYFEGNNVDNDAVQGLLDLVEGSDDWGIVVISKSGGTLETAVAFRIFLDALRKVVRRRPGKAPPPRDRRHRRVGPAARAGRRPSAATTSSPFPTAWAGASRSSAPSACCRRP